MTFLATLISSADVVAQKVKVSVTSIRSEKGQLILAIFKDQQSFKDNKPFKRQKYSKATLANGSVVFSVTLEPGIYGLSVLDDEDNNSKMEFNMLGIPKEGFGFSDYYHNSLTRPVLADFDFELNGDKSVVVKMRYL